MSSSNPQAPRGITRFRPEELDTRFRESACILCVLIMWEGSGSHERDATRRNPPAQLINAPPCAAPAARTGATGGNTGATGAGASASAGELAAPPACEPHPREGGSSSSPAVSLGVVRSVKCFEFDSFRSQSTPGSCMRAHPRPLEVAAPCTPHSPPWGPMGARGPHGAERLRSQMGPRSHDIAPRSSITGAGH